MVNSPCSITPEGLRIICDLYKHLVGKTVQIVTIDGTYRGHFKSIDINVFLDLEGVSVNVQQVTKVEEIK